jgi:hypothetical protein
MAKPRSVPFVDGVPAHNIERRAAVRYTCKLASACHPVPEGDVFCSARVLDISSTGIGLLVDRPVEPETVLAVELQSDDPTLSYVLLVEVRHARARKEREWLLGCAFARELSEYELKALL